LSTQSLKNKLKKVKATLPAPPPPYEELPIEEWLAEEIADPPDWYLQNSADEERFYQWLEGLPLSSLGFGLGSRVAKVRDPSRDMTGPIPLPPTQLLIRALDALPPYIEHRRQVWVENFPARERRRQLIAEHEIRYEKKVKTATGGGSIVKRTTHASGRSTPTLSRNGQSSTRSGNRSARGRERMHPWMITCAMLLFVFVF
jgi:hypothetical protein